MYKIIGRVPGQDEERFVIDYLPNIPNEGNFIVRDSKKYVVDRVIFNIDAQTIVLWLSSRDE